MTRPAKAKVTRGGSNEPLLIPPPSPAAMLTDALVLALTAPTDKDVDRAVALAEEIARACSEFEVFAAKRDALRRLNMIGDSPDGD